LANLAKTSINIDSILDKVRTRGASPTLERAARPLGTGPRTIRPKVPLITCYFHAEMEEEVLLNHATTVEVAISREILAAGKGPAAATGAGKVKPDRKILLQVIPKAEFVLVEKDRLELDPPLPGKPQTFYFDLKAAHVGIGEIWVVARQEQVPLVTLVLKPTVVEKRSDQAMPRLQVNAKTPEAPSLEEPLHQLLIVEQRGKRIDLFLPITVSLAEFIRQILFEAVSRRS
jgi:hypothetical protein